MKSPGGERIGGGGRVRGVNEEASGERMGRDE